MRRRTSSKPEESRKSVLEPTGRAMGRVENRNIHSIFTMCSGTYFTHSERQLEVLLKDLAGKQLGVEPWLSALSN